MKATKEQANYRDGTDERHCSICTMFRPPASCSSVEGEIAPQKLCDYFKRKPKFGTIGPFAS
jgi:hypothetical protein